MTKIVVLLCALVAFALTMSLALGAAWLFGNYPPPTWLARLLPIVAAFLLIAVGIKVSRAGNADG